MREGGVRETGGRSEGGRSGELCVCVCVCVCVPVITFTGGFQCALCALAFEVCVTI